MKRLTFIWDVAIEVENDKFVKNDESEVFIKTIEENDIKYSIILNDGFDWPIVQFDGEFNKIINIAMLLDASSKSYEQLFNLFLNWDGEDESLAEILG